ncbi:type IA DNA topoisomerase, partial [Ornithobacterium rhinotracheale]
MKVILAEKPSVGREIAHLLGANSKKDGYLEGNGYAVTWAFGHLVQLAMPEAYGCVGFQKE